MPKKPKSPAPDAAKELTQDECLDVLNATYEFSEKHEEEWKNQVARDLNQLMGHAVWWLETCGDEMDIMFGNAVVRTVQRVAEFEEIEKGEKPCTAIPT